VSLTSDEIEAVVAELAPLAGARVEDVRVHAERALTLDLFAAAGPARLLLSAEPDLTRIHAVRARPPRAGGAPPLQQLLRRELEGFRVAAIEALPGDRVVALRFEGPRGALQLVAELMGRHGNVFLVGPDGVIRASMGRSLSQRRRLVPGAPYVAPVLAGGHSPNARARPSEALRGAPLGPPLARDQYSRRSRAPSLGPPGGPGQPHPAAPPRARAQSRFAPVPGERFPLSAAIEDAYAAREEERLLAEARRRLREPVRAAIARAARAQEKIADEAARVPAAESDRRMGDLLKQNLARVRRGAREVVLTEWTEAGPREVKVALDPALSPQANLERYYRRYRRIVESAARVAARAADVRAREAALRALLAEIDRAALPELEKLERDARRLGAGPRPAAPGRRNKDEAAPPYRTFRSLAGAAILVGRGPEENDALTVRVARGNDLWLHARGVAGAHVVVRLEKGRAPDQESFLDAAHLAIHFSDARGAPQAEVASTRAKYVRKAKGAAPGAVTYSQEKVVFLRIEPKRVERLLAEEEGP
jgi:predicted ribosome quality control (RQC) complex YloA/Tae2 family protein